MQMMQSQYHALQYSALRGKNVRKIFKMLKSVFYLKIKNTLKNFFTSMIKSYFE